jgi:glycerophosphoryl diester phosphodiesterase
MTNFSRAMGRREFLGYAFSGAVVCAVGAAQVAGQGTDAARGGKKFVVGHRGACAYAPENTLPSYRLAIAQRADYVEQDLQITKDGVLVCSHDETLERTTNVAEVFPERYSDSMVKGKSARRWHFHDFTLKEIKELDAGAKFNAKFKGTTIPTWQEAIDEIKGKAGLCPEIKNPEVYAKVGLSMEQLFYELLKKNGLDKPNEATPILIQSFNRASLKQLGQYGLKHPMLQLLSAGMKWTPEKLEGLKACATAIGPSKEDVTEEMVRAAHARGLQVVAYTYNAKSLPAKFPSVRAEIEHALFDLGVDGLFTDNPDQFPRKA